MTEKVDFKKLIEEHGAKKAAETVRTTGKPLTEDFAKSHKKMNTFSNKTTDEITQQLVAEQETETTTSKNVVQFEIPLSILSTTQNHTIEEAQETINA